MDFKFLWGRIKEKKFGYLLILIILALVWLPTFTGEDLFIVIPLITLLGFKVYLTVALVIIALVIFFLNGKLNKIKSLFKKPKEKEVKRICEKMHKTEKAVNKCIKNNVIKSFDDGKKKNNL